MKLVHRVGVVPASVKNSRQPIVVRSKGGKQRVIFKISDKAKTDRALIRSILAGVTIPADHDVRLDLRWLVNQDAIEWLVTDLGPRPKGRKGRQDLQGVIEALCDAIQRDKKDPSLPHQVENDSQVAIITAEKVYA